MVLPSTGNNLIFFTLLTLSVPSSVTSVNQLLSVVESSSTHSPAKQILSLLLEQTPKPGGVTLKIRPKSFTDSSSSEGPYLEYGGTLHDQNQKSSTIFPTYFALEHGASAVRKVRNKSANSSYGNRRSNQTSFTAPILEKPIVNVNYHNREDQIHFLALKSTPSSGHFISPEKRMTGRGISRSSIDTYEKLTSSASVSSSSEEFIGSGSDSLDEITGSSYMIRSRDMVEPSYIMGGFLRREIWTIPVLVFSSINILLVVLFEIYVLCRAKGQSRRHLFLGQMLLFALFLSSSLALVFAIYPSLAGCYLSRLVLGIAYSMIFSVLLVKCVFLLSLNKGIYLPASYQGLLLFFAVMVQVAIDIQWTVLDPPNFQVWFFKVC